MSFSIPTCVLYILKELHVFLLHSGSIMIDKLRILFIVSSRRLRRRERVNKTDFRGSLANHGRATSILLPPLLERTTTTASLCTTHHSDCACQIQLQLSSFFPLTVSPFLIVSAHATRTPTLTHTRNCIHMTSKRTLYPGHSQASHISCLAAIPNYDLFLSASVSIPSNHLYFAPPIGFEPATSYL